jgi:DNA-binding NtrC family response regulator
VEDNPRQRALYARRLEEEGYAVRQAASGEQALDEFDERTNVVVADMLLPGMDGAALMAGLHERRPDLPVIILTNRGKLGESLDLLRRGAFDYVQKTASFKDLALRVARAAEHEALAREVTALRARLAQSQDVVASRAPAMSKVLERIGAVAGTDYPVLLTGESGTGKEVLARQIHLQSKRRERPFIALNCGAIPRDLFESELFGHRKGSFTGAVADRAGVLEEADGGTLLLDEIGDTPASQQVKLLRALEEGELQRVGEAAPRKVDVRLIAATNRDLAAAVADASFREDLYYRISLMPIELPPLRERSEDIPALAAHFLDLAMAETGKRIEPLSREVLEALRRHAWPGNIRELANRIRQAVILCQGGSVRTDDLQLGGNGPRAARANGEMLSLPLAQARRRFEKMYLEGILRQQGGNVSRAADQSGKHRSEFYSLLKRHDIDPESFRPPQRSD